MYKHHKETIHKITEKLKVDDEILAILLSGSIAHGFESPNSDVDIMMIVSEENYKRRAEKGELTYFERETCTYDDGYIDGKYISISFMEKVAVDGSEPARFAFDGAVILYSIIDGLEELLHRITKYPINKKDENIKRFCAQFEAWKWYCYEAIRHNNEYLLNHSISNYILFGGRLVLAHNEILYPYHKWFMKVLSEAEKKPEDLMKIINDLLSYKDKDSIEKFYECITGLIQWDDINWGSQFVIDSEQNWINGNVPVADI